ncbi:carboxymuconolactone decarboxylase family protein [Actinomadura kijaniata]|uniref:AhpD family alkylhydroperoxidase n=1 Tax=Actinomadura namibiensis TaxID=182080 RepID=A0A7W3QPP1_ACTNM|nr:MULTISPECIES: carboxymuconolactone decarboxylase family protein [Actinomadura]MBA8954852.1 AhpD family alkylhydroperoxidase [Actinomadura namibiensis]
MTRQRIELAAVSPRSVGLVSELEEVLRREGLTDDRLRELARIRVAQLNGCAYFLAQRIREALHLGEKQERLNELAGWRDSERFTESERAALALTEVMTRLPAGGVPDDEYGEAERLLGPYNLANLIMAVSVANALDRMCLAARVPPRP